MPFWADTEGFQSLSREKPFCHHLGKHPERKQWARFNRSVAKSPSATPRVLGPLGERAEKVDCERLVLERYCSRVLVALQEEKRQF